MSDIGSCSDCPVKYSCSISKITTSDKEKKKKENLRRYERKYLTLLFIKDRCCYICKRLLENGMPFCLDCLNSKADNFIPKFKVRKVFLRRCHHE